MHKQEATNGCIFIVDPATPEMDDPDPNKLGEFEPKLIRDILAAVGRTEADTKGRFNLGKMHVVDIK